MNLGLHALVDTEVLSSPESIDVDHVGPVDVAVVPSDNQLGLKRLGRVLLEEALSHLLEFRDAADQFFQVGSVVALKFYKDEDQAVKSGVSQVAFVN